MEWSIAWGIIDAVVMLVGGVMAFFVGLWLLGRLLCFVFGVSPR